MENDGNDDDNEGSDDDEDYDDDDDDIKDDDNDDDNEDDDDDDRQVSRPRHPGPLTLDPTPPSCQPPRGQPPLI